MALNTLPCKPLIGSDALTGSNGLVNIDLPCFFVFTVLKIEVGQYFYSRLKQTTGIAGLVHNPEIFAQQQPD